MDDPSHTEYHFRPMYKMDKPYALGTCASLECNGDISVYYR